MALQPPRDLSPRYDVKGGSPRTPPKGIPVSNYQEYAMPIYGNGVWKTLAGAAGGLWIMSLLAWWTAFQTKGISQNELREFMLDYKQGIAEHVTSVDTQIGEIKGKQEKIQSDLSHVQYQQVTDENNFSEFKAKTEKTNDLVAGYLEQLKSKK